MTPESLLSNLALEFAKSRLLNEYRIGQCRSWSRDAEVIALTFLLAQNLPATIEAREVTIEPGLEHTFLRILVNGFPPILADGVGTINFDPYLGWEDEAPDHLLNSHQDLLVMSRFLPLHNALLTNERKAS